MIINALGDEEYLGDVLVRSDLNVPMVNNEISDDFRISKSLEIIDKIYDFSRSITFVSHLGRPKGVKDPYLSLMPIYKYLKKHLQTNVYFFAGNFDDEVKKKFSHLKMVLFIGGFEFDCTRYWWRRLHRLAPV